MIICLYSVELLMYMCVWILCSLYSLVHTLWSDVYKSAFLHYSLWMYEVDLLYASTMATLFNNHPYISSSGMPICTRFTATYVGMVVE